MEEFIKDNWRQLLVLVLVVAFLYAFGVNGPLFWDDMDWIVNNPFIQSFTWSNIYNIFTQNILAGANGTSNYYRPLLLVSFIPNYLLSGTNPVLYHIVNDLIHLANGVLIYYLLLHWFGKKRIAFLAALLFLIHPLQTEAVAYVVGRGDPLSVLFILGGILLYIKKRFWLAMGAMIFAVLTRETGVLFPAYLGIVLIAFEHKGLFWERFTYAFIKVLPFAGISAVYGILRLTVLNFQNTLNFSNQQNFYTEHVLYRIYTFFDALSLYVQLIFWPTGLHFFHDIPGSMTFWEGLVWLGGLIILACILWLFWLYRRKEKLAFNIWFFGLGIFFANLSLSSGIVASINARAMEHWLYFSLFGVFTIVAWYVDRLWSYLETYRPQLKTVCVTIFAVYCLFLGYQTIQRNLIWADSVALLKNILQYEPNNYHALNNLGNWYYDRRDNATAKFYWEQSIVANPYQPVAYTNLGYLASDEGRTLEAEKIFKKAIDLDPYYYNAYYNLLVLYIQEKRFPEALQVLETVQGKYPKKDFTTIENNIKDLQKSSTSTAPSRR